MFRDGPLTRAGRRKPSATAPAAARSARCSSLQAIRESSPSWCGTHSRGSSATSARDFPRRTWCATRKAAGPRSPKSPGTSRRRFGAFPLPLDIRGTDLQQRVWRGAQNPLRRDVNLLTDREGDRCAEGDPRGRQLLLAQLVCLRGALSSRAAHAAVAAKAGSTTGSTTKRSSRAAHRLGQRFDRRDPGE